MSTNASNPNDSVFGTPDLSGLQSDENKADLRERYSFPDEVVAGEAELPESASGDRTFDPDEVSRGESDTAIAPEDRHQENLFNRQVGITFGSGS